MERKTEETKKETYKGEERMAMFGRWSFVPLLLTIVVVIISFANVSNSSIPAGFVNVLDVDPTIIVEMRYATMHNFVGSTIMGYDSPNVCTFNHHFSFSLFTLLSFLPLSQLHKCDKENETT